MGFLKRKEASFYPLKGIILVIKFDEVGHMDLISVFPSVIAFGISLPFDEVLELSRVSMTSVASYQLHFVFRFSINQVRRWSGEVGAM